MVKHIKSLFVFRRDLRIEDNTALLQALRESEQVIACFIFDPRQVGAQNKFKSNNSLQFMIESLIDLQKQLKKKKGRLYLFNGVAEKVIARIIKQETIDAVYVNRDYTLFSIKRDEAIKKACIKNNSAFYSYGDALLNEPETITTQSGTPYSIFTAFYRRSTQEKVRQPQLCRMNNFYVKKIKNDQTPVIYKKILPSHNKKIYVHGGTQCAHKIIAGIVKLKNYSQTRDIPSLETSNLAAHLKFGTLSIRQAYYGIVKKLGVHHLLLKQLYWRDFFTHVAYHSPFVFGQPYHAKYKKLWWSKDMSLFKAWCNGATGFPLIDAGMRQLNTTGFMHNRVRMVVASFLTKDLHINWLWGEKYFAQQLVDYDPSVNNGNWQWCASTGCDAQPYFRIFNPWLQQRKFDPECIYIKRWLPELKAIPNKTIHSWFKKTQVTINGYPRPLVEHDVESKKAKSLYRNVRP